MVRRASRADWTYLSSIFSTPAAGRWQTSEGQLYFTTARGLEPLRAEPNGFRAHLLSRSDTLSDDRCQVARDARLILPY